MVRHWQLEKMILVWAIHEVRFELAPPPTGDPNAPDRNRIFAGFRRYGFKGSYSSISVQTSYLRTKRGSPDRRSESEG
jgi:hypothetical protein